MVNSLRVCGALRLAGGALLVGMVAVLSPLGAKAGDLVCNRCVGTSDIAKKAISTSRLKPGAVSTNRLRDNAVTGAKVLDGTITGADLAPGTVDAANLAPSVMDGMPISIFATLMDGETQTLATNGTVSIFAICTINPSGLDMVRVFAVSSEEGWYWSVDPQRALTADSPRQILDSWVSTGTAQYKQINKASSHVSPSGYALTVTPYSLSVGVNVFMQDCIITGTIFPSSTVLP